MSGAFQRPFTRFAAAVAGFKLEEGRCPICKHEVRVEEFKSEKAIDEYKISGLCQECQYDIFKEE
jgi:hypothetical protein